MIQHAFHFFPQLKPERKVNFYILGLLIFIGSIFEILNLGIFVEFINLVTTGENYGHSSGINKFLEHFNIRDFHIDSRDIIFSFILISIASCLLRVYLIFYQTRISHYIGSDFSTGIFRNSLYQTYSYHITRNSSNILSGITIKSESIIYNFVLPILTILSSIPLLLSILVTLFFINSIATILSILIFSFAYIAISFFTRNILDINSKKINDESNNIIRVAQEGLGGIRDIILDSTQRIYCDIFNASDIQYRKSAIKIEIIGASPRYVIELFGMVLIALFALTMSGAGEGKTSLITLAALAFGAQRMLPLFQQIYQSLSRIRGGRDRVQEALQLLGDAHRIEIADSVSSYTRKSAGLAFNNFIEIRDLSFAYDSAVNSVLKNLNLRIQKGSRLGLVGATGGGKSTLLDLIMGLLMPTSGNIFIDGIPLNHQNIALWRANIAHVPQTIFLKDASILENIAFGVTPAEIDFARARQAAQRAMISEEVESWPTGYSTQVGERGVRLSGGQRQRIGIARALYKGASVMILDEATSALDEYTEGRVMNSLYSLSENVTFIIVAHRVTTLSGCDMIVNLADGNFLINDQSI